MMTIHPRCCLVVASLLALLAIPSTHAFYATAPMGSSSSLWTVSTTQLAMSDRHSNRAKPSTTRPFAGASDNTNDSDTTDPTSLSSLVSDMLQSHKEMQQEMQAMTQQNNENNDTGMPTLGDDGIYRITSEQEYKTFFAAHTDKLIVLKFSSKTCQACKVLHQKLRSYLHREPVLQQDIVVFADVSVVPQRNVHQPAAAFTTFVTTQCQVTRIPDVQFYTPTRKRSTTHERVDEFHCDATLGCSWMELHDKLLHFCTIYGNQLTKQQQQQEDGSSRRGPVAMVRRWFSSSS